MAVIWLAKEGGSSESIRVHTVSGMEAGATEEFELTTTLANDAGRCVLNARSGKVGALNE